MKPAPLTDQELQLRAQIDRLCAQRAELTLIIQGLQQFAHRQIQIAANTVMFITNRREIRKHDIGVMRHDPVDFRTAVQADDNHPGCGFQQRGVWHGIGVIDLHRLKFQLIAAAFDAPNNVPSM